MCGLPRQPPRSHGAPAQGRRRHEPGLCEGQPRPGRALLSRLRRRIGEEQLGSPHDWMRNGGGAGQGGDAGGGPAPAELGSGGREGGKKKT